MSGQDETGTVKRPAPGPLLPKGRLTGPMPWVIAIMMFLTVLAFYIVGDTLRALTDPRPGAL